MFSTSSARHLTFWLLAMAIGAITGNAENPVELKVVGEGDSDYPLESSTDLKIWQALGTINIWAPRSDPTSEDQKYFRIGEPQT